MVKVWNIFHGEPTHFPNNKARLWLCKMVYVEVILQLDVDCIIIPNIGVVNTFSKVKHIAHGLHPQQ
jgi:hypothetical protein